MYYSGFYYESSRAETKTICPHNRNLCGLNLFHYNDESICYQKYVYSRCHISHPRCARFCEHMGNLLYHQVHFPVISQE